MALSKKPDPRKQRYYRRHRKRLLAKRAVEQAVVRKKFEAEWGKPDHCEVCGTPTTRLCWDHNPGTGAFRGWLCFNCNLAIGHAKDDPDRLRKLANYLEERNNGRHRQEGQTQERLLHEVGHE